MTGKKVLMSKKKAEPKKKEVKPKRPSSLSAGRNGRLVNPH